MTRHRGPLAAPPSTAQRRPLGALLVDDEPLATERLARLLASQPGIEVVATAASASEARHALSRAEADGAARPIDVVFLDVEMPGETGIAVLPAVSKNTIVVFVTAYPQYAIQAFQVGALDYLLKPIDPDRLEQTIDRVRKILPLLRADPVDDDDDEDPLAAMFPPPGGRDSLPATATIHMPLVNAGPGIDVQLVDICWIEGMRNYSRVALRFPERTLICRRRLADWRTELPPVAFPRISKSLLVNMSALEKSHWLSRDETVLLFGGREDRLTIGRLAASRLREILGAMPGGSDEAPRG